MTPRRREAWDRLAVAEMIATWCEDKDDPALNEARRRPDDPA